MGRRLWSGERLRSEWYGKKREAALGYGIPPPSDKGVEGDRPEKK